MAGARAALGEGSAGHRVVDIGGGSGLLAMMAARAGADQVVTVERVAGAHTRPPLSST